MTNGIIDFINVKSVTLRQALSAFLRPLSLDFRAMENHIFVSTPERLRKAEFARLSPTSENSTRGTAGRQLVSVGPEFFGSEFSFGETYLKLDGGELVWSGIPVEKNNSIKSISNPNLINFSGSKSSIAMKAEQPVEYFEEMGANREQGLEGYVDGLDKGHGLYRVERIKFRRKGRSNILHWLVELGGIEGRVRIEGGVIDGVSSVDMESIPVWKVIVEFLR